MLQFVMGGVSLKIQCCQTLSLPSWLTFSEEDRVLDRLEGLVLDRLKDHHFSSGRLEDRRSSWDRVDRRSSWDRVDRRSSWDRVDRRSSWDRVGRHSSLDQVGRHSSLDRVDRHSSLDRVGRHSSWDRVGRRSSLDRVDRRSSLDRVDRRSSWDRVGLLESEAPVLQAHLPLPLPLRILRHNAGKLDRCLSPGRHISRKRTYLLLVLLRFFLFSRL
jgi:hypothetical protein